MYFRAIIDGMVLSVNPKELTQFRESMPAIAAFEKNQEPASYGFVDTNGHQLRVVHLCDDGTLSILIPHGTALKVVAFVRRIEGLDADARTPHFSVRAVVRHFLRCRLDFGVCDNKVPRKRTDGRQGHSHRLGELVPRQKYQGYRGELHAPHLRDDPVH